MPHLRTNKWVVSSPGTQPSLSITGCFPDRMDKLGTPLYFGTSVLLLLMPHAYFCFRETHSQPVWETCSRDQDPVGHRK